MGIKLWVDDYVPAPDGWHWARTNTEAIRILDTQDVEEVAIDHDIAHESSPGSGMMLTCPETFEPTARFIALKQFADEVDEQSAWPLKVTIQTGSVVGREVLQMILTGVAGVELAVELTKKPHQW